jgi:hypothetical protein
VISFFAWPFHWAMSLMFHCCLGHISLVAYSNVLGICWHVIDFLKKKFLSDDGASFLDLESI